MIRSFRYRLLPTRSQITVLDEWLSLTREIYNAALFERKDAWQKQKISISLYGQQAQLATVRAERDDMAAIPQIIMRGALRRLNKAFTSFFQRCCKTGEKPGYPRFKSAQRWNSISIHDLYNSQRPHLSPIVAGGKRVKIPFIGKVKLRIADDRPLRGTPKSMHITRKLGQWFITFACDDVPTKPLPITGNIVGVDLGLLHFATTSDGETFKNPHPLRAARIAVERAQRIMTRRKRGSKRYRVAANTLARKHARVTGIRREHHIAFARSLVSRYDTICVEDLNIRGLARGMLSKSVGDAGWGGALTWLAVKAEEAARDIVRVPPPGTSKTCSRCGVVKEKMTLADRMFRCDGCGLTIDRDLNAAINIKAIGIQLKAAGMQPQGAAPLVRGRRRSAIRTDIHRNVADPSPGLAKCVVPYTTNNIK